jgi:hypothetical protein
MFKYVGYVTETKAHISRRVAVRKDKYCEKSSDLFWGKNYAWNASFIGTSSPQLSIFSITHHPTWPKPKTFGKYLLCSVRSIASRGKYLNSYPVARWHTWFGRYYNPHTVICELREKSHRHLVPLGNAESIWICRGDYYLIIHYLMLYKITIYIT